MKLANRQRLSNYTSLRAGGEADRLIELDKEDSLAEILGSENQQPVWLLGYGTNCLVSDKGLPGTVVLNRFGKTDWLSSTRVKVDSGCNWDEFVLQVMAKDLWGLEFTSGIPGGVGAAIAGNIAAYGQKVADTFIEATMMDTATGEISKWPNERFEFNYRSSVLQKPQQKTMAVLDATFELQLQTTGELEYESALKVARELDIIPDSLESRRKIIMATRDRAGSLLSSSSRGPWTAGSFFKNPLVDEKQVEAIITFDESGITHEQLLRQNQIHGQDKARVSAALVLLAAGFKRGQTWGNVRLHPQHILKVENIGNASASEIYKVIEHILETVHQKLGIHLEPEVRFLGEF